MFFSPSKSMMTDQRRQKIKAESGRMSVPTVSCPAAVKFVSGPVN
jgi:hypothetical protein